MPGFVCSAWVRMCTLAHISRTHSLPEIFLFSPVGSCAWRIVFAQPHNQQTAFPLALLSVGSHQACPLLEKAWRSLEGVWSASLDPAWRCIFVVPPTLASASLIPSSHHSGLLKRQASLRGLADAFHRTSPSLLTSYADLDLPDQRAVLLGT